MEFTCSICKSKHPAVEIDPLTKTVKLPASITTRRNENGEWVFVCVDDCMKDNKL